MTDAGAFTKRRTCLDIERNISLIDVDGTIAAVWRKVKPNTHAAEILTALESGVPAREGHE